MRRMIMMFTVVALALTSSVIAEQERDLWYAISIAGARSGWLHETRSKVPEGWQTEQESKIEIRRGAQSVSMQVTSRFVEGKDGQPVRAESIQKLAGTAITTTWTFLGNGVIKEVSTQLGRTNERDIPPSQQEWLSPVAAERFFLARVASGAKTIRWSTVLPDQGPEPVELTRTLVDETTFNRGGRAIPATRWKSTTSAMPGSVGEDLVATDGVLLRQVTSLPFGEMRVELTDEATAKMASENVPELLVSLFVQLDKPIKQARTSRTLEMLVRAKDGVLEDLPSAGAQRSERLGEGEILIKVNLDEPLPATDAELADPRYRSPSALADAADETVSELTAQALRGLESTSIRRQAERLRLAVAMHISNKGLSTGFASATETAKSKAGDCSEHAVLLVAMLRSAGIPARGATGLVYVEGYQGAPHAFGWHMWTQALVDGVWVDLDATLPLAYDAAHLLTATTPLDGATMDRDISGLLQLMGDLDITIREEGS